MALPRDRAEPLPQPPRPWHTLPASEVEAALETGPAGLTAAEAARRRARVGPNEVRAEREAPWWRVLLRQFQDPLIYILLGAAAVTLALGDYKDSAVILAVLVINGAIGFTQEVRARAAIRGLARLAAPRADLVRDGEAREVDGRDVVPGDVAVLTSGDRVPADIRLSEARDLEVDESALTGESVPARKTTEPLATETLVPADRTNMAFAGTVVTRGRGRGIVVRTGSSTELGRIAVAVREVGETPTPLQQKTERLGRWVGLAIVAGSVVAFAAGLVRELPLQGIFLTVVALAVAVVPEGLPVVFTVTLAVGVRRMARRNAIVRSLPAVETLGSTTVIGSDKTGTLTRNQMTVRAIRAGGRDYTVTGGGYRLEGAIELRSRPADVEREPALERTLLAGVLANEAGAAAVEAGRPEGDPTEIALMVVAAKAGLRPSELRRRFAQRDILPFEPERRFMATLDEEPGGARTIHVKGAPEAVLERCDRMLGPEGVEPLDRGAARMAARAMGARGLRVLAMAFRRTQADRLTPAELDAGFVFAGLQGMEDPVRPEAVEAVRAAHGAGIRVLMITGDHLDTARAIGRTLGLGDEGARAVEGRELETLDDKELDRVVKEVEIYARVAPEHKLRLVQRLKAGGEIVAVTGDGVNDAPALRAAHLGVAMGRGGTDVAREASDIVLADDNFATITAAVEEGRVAFGNLRKATFFLLSTGAGMLFTILAALFGGFPLPFLPAQILWINLVTSGIQDVALALEPGEPGLLRRGPRPPGEGVVTLRLLERLAGVGAVLAAGTLASFWWALDGTGDLTYARSVAMTQMVVFQFFHAFNSRSLDRSILRIPPLGNPFLFGGILLALLAHLALLYTPALQSLFRTAPIGAEDWGRILLIGTAVVVGGELDKWWIRRRRRPIG